MAPHILLLFLHRYGSYSTSIVLRLLFIALAVLHLFCPSIRSGLYLSCALHVYLITHYEPVNKRSVLQLHTSFTPLLFSFHWKQTLQHSGLFLSTDLEILLNISAAQCPPCTPPVQRISISCCLMTRHLCTSNERAYSFFNLIVSTTSSSSLPITSIFIQLCIFGKVSKCYGVAWPFIKLLSFLHMKLGNPLPFLSDLLADARSFHIWVQHYRSLSPLAFAFFKVCKLSSWFHSVWISAQPPSHSRLHSLTASSNVLVSIWTSNVQECNWCKKTQSSLVTLLSC